MGLFQAHVAKTIDVARHRKQASSFNGIISNGNAAKPWKAQVNIDGKMRTVGAYATEREAADAFDFALRERTISYTMLGSQSPSLRVLRHVSWACPGSDINGRQRRLAQWPTSASLTQNLTLHSLLTRTPRGEVGALISIRRTTLRKRA